MTAPTRIPSTPNSKSGNKNGDKPTPTDRKALIDGLNHDLAGEYQAILMYIHYSAKLTGPYRRELRALFQAEIADEQGHAQFLSDKVAALGGEPTTQPRSVPMADQPREMLEQALTAEKQAIADYNARILQAEGCEEFGLKVVLENQVADETRHKEELEAHSRRLERHQARTDAPTRAGCRRSRLGNVSHGCREPPVKNGGICARNQVGLGVVAKVCGLADCPVEETFRRTEESVRPQVCLRLTRGHRHRVLFADTRDHAGRHRRGCGHRRNPPVDFQRTKISSEPFKGAVCHAD